MSILTQEATAIGTPHDVRAYGWSAAWRLPPDETCADAARSAVRETLTGMRASDEVVYAATVVAGELSVNAFAHVLGSRPRQDATPGLPELWIHPVVYPEPRLVISVFDADRNHMPNPVRSATLDGSGRGLRTVAAVSVEWGCRLTRSRVGPWHVPGKAVWAAIALPAQWARTRSVRPEPTTPTAAENLHAALAARGVDRIYRNGDDRLQVISVRAGLTVWVGDTIQWRDETGDYRHLRLEDVPAAVEQIISRHEELALLPDRTAQLHLATRPMSR